MTNLHRILFPVLDTLLRANRDSNVIMGLVLGVFLGAFPIATLQWFLSVLGLLILRANVLAFLIAFSISFGAGHILDPVWNSLGFRLLTTNSAFYPLWGWMQHAPVVPFTEFNNTVVLGSSLAAIAVAPVVGTIFFVFRNQIRNGISRLWYHTKISRFYAHYRKY